MTIRFLVLRLVMGGGLPQKHTDLLQYLATWHISLHIVHICNWLVAWNMNFIFPYIGNVIIPTDEVIFFQRDRLNHQPGKVHWNPMWFSMCWILSTSRQSIAHSLCSDPKMGYIIIYHVTYHQGRRSSNRSGITVNYILIYIYSFYFFFGM